jgi:hypothetical protein
MLSEGIAVKGTDVSSEDRQDITSILSYFDSRHDLDAVKALPDGFMLSDMERVLGFPMYYGDPEYEDKNTYFSFMSAADSPVDISGYDLMIDLSDAYEEVYAFPESGLEIRLDDSHTVLKILYSGEQVIEKDLTEYALELIGNDPGLEYGATLPADDMTFIIESGEVNVKIVFTSIEGNYEDAELAYLYTRFILLVDIK